MSHEDNITSLNFHIFFFVFVFSEKVAVGREGETRRPTREEETRGNEKSESEKDLRTKYGREKEKEKKKERESGMLTECSHVLRHSEGVHIDAFSVKILMS